jgi:DhnA family fructose-bisphosphate aldolase class Ia
MNIAPRLGRLLAEDGNCFDVAIDHGIFNEVRFLDSIENMRQVIAAVVEANPDAIQLSPGQAPILQAIPGKNKPSLVLRTDVANVYGQELPHHLFSEIIANPVEQAIRLDAACVVANLFCIPNQPEVYQACLKNINALKPECERYGMQSGAIWSMGILTRYRPSFGRQLNLEQTSSRPIQPKTRMSIIEWLRSLVMFPCWSVVAAKLQKRRSSSAPML